VAEDEAVDVDGAEGIDVLWGALGTSAAEAVDEAPEPDSEPEPAFGADEWDDLRQMLAGEDEPAPPVLEADEEPDGVEQALEADESVVAFDEVDGDDEEPEEGADLGAVVAELAERVETLAVALEAERGEREALADQLDVLARELDAVLGEALEEERKRRSHLEDTLRQVQATLSEVASPRPSSDGPERREGEDRRAGTERRRGVRGVKRERPLRARDVAPVEEPVAQVTDGEDAQHGLEAEPSVWRSRLHEVAGSVSAWSAEDIDRLRAEEGRRRG
jgi:hypothetical protein